MSQSDIQETATAPGSQTDVTIVLSSDVLTKLRSHVAFQTVGDVQNLVADALNSYIQLGQLSANGAQIFARQGQEGDLVRLHFPFNPTPVKAGAED